jgi:hypothetical protein
MAFSPVGSNPYFVQLGIEPTDLEQFGVPLLEGRYLASGATNEILLGREAADQLDKKLSDTVELKDRSFTVVGILPHGQRLGGRWGDAAPGHAAGIRTQIGADDPHLRQG